MEQQVNECPDVIYHYCSTHVFWSIVSNKKIRLSDLSLSNDSQEGKWAVNRYLSSFKDGDGKARKVVEEILREAIGNRVALGSCFSSKRDLLSQWRGYASDGKGVCIGFDTTKLKHLSSKNADGIANIDLVKVDYCYTSEISTKTHIYERLGPAIKQARIQSGGELTISRNLENGGHEKDTLLVKKLFGMKNPAFEEESEWRLLCVDYPSNISEIKYGESNSMLKAYLELDIPNDLIVSVTLGPIHPTPMKVVERFLEANLQTARVLKSSSSLVSH